MIHYVPKDEQNAIDNWKHTYLIVSCDNLHVIRTLGYSKFDRLNATGSTAYNDDASTLDFLRLQ